MDKDSNKDSSQEEGKDMSVLEKDIKSKNLWKIAEKNTKRNSDGLTVCSKECPYREEPQWEKSIKKSE